MKNILKHLKKYRMIILFVVILVTIQSVADLYLPTLMSDIINNGISKVEYNIDNEKFKDNISNGNLPEIEAMLAPSGITKENIKNIDDESFSKLTESFNVNSDEEADLNNIEPEALALMQKLTEYEIITTKPVTDMDYILKTGGIMLLVVLVATVATILASYLSSKVGSGFAANLRGAVFRKVGEFSQSNVNKFGAPSLITRTTNDVTQIETATTTILKMLIGAPITLVGAIIMANTKNSSLTWIIAIAIPLMLVLIIVVMGKAMPLFKKLQDKLDGLNKVFREQLSGIKVIRAFDKTKTEEKRFKKTNEEYVEIAIKVNRIMALVMPLIWIIFDLTQISIMWYGGHAVNEGNMKIGDLMAFIQYAMQILFSFLMFAMMFIVIPRASASVTRINEVLATEADVKNRAKTINKTNKKGVLEFKNVSFQYPDGQEKVLSNISFKAEPGKTTAIIGSTGSGKSSIVQLIERFFDVTDGKILIDGVDIRDYDIEYLRQLIGMIPQKAYLFSGTIKDNIKYGKEDATDKEIWEALKVAQSEEFVKELDKKLESSVSQGGSNFSGGQKQRLSIARALVRKPKIYVFDDSFSALDFKTDSNLREALKSETKDSAQIIVAQRVSTIMDADQILVVHEGEIVGIGKHKELLKTCNIYKEIVESQLSEEEINAEGSKS